MRKIKWWTCTIIISTLNLMIRFLSKLRFSLQLKRQEYTDMKQALKFLDEMFDKEDEAR